MIATGSIIDGQVKTGEGRKLHEVRSPYSQELVGTIEFATQEDLQQAIASSHRVFRETMRKMPAYKRSEILRKAADLLETRTEEFAKLLSAEAGKPIRDSRGEVGRAVQVLRFASEEAKQLNGELVNLDSAVGGEGRIGMARRYPIGVVAAITPFNFPLNLVLHKVGPAIAAGNTVVLKPAEKTPLSPTKLYDLFREAGLPEGALQIVMGGPEIVESLVTDTRVSKITFTGSGPVGFRLKQLAGNKKVTLELGSNSPNILFEDADLEAAAAGLVRGGFSFAGQACISVQRIYVQKAVYQRFLDLFVPMVQSLKLGDPSLETTDVGPMITIEAAERAGNWIQEAAAEGAQVLTGGNRTRNLLEPTVLSNVNPAMKVVCQEVFAPIVAVIPFETEEEVIEAANRSDYGLQAGVFTSDINRAFRLAEELETGGVWINEISSFRQDHYPYGGVKQSGIGREGVKYAIEDMTEIKFLGIKLL